MMSITIKNEDYIIIIPASVEQRKKQVAMYPAPNTNDPPDNSSPSVSTIQTITKSSPSNVKTENETETAVNYEGTLGRAPAMTTCIYCKQKIVTRINFKPGAFFWVMLVLTFILGMLPLLIFLFSVRVSLDVHHSCPCCHKLLYVKKKKCCDERKSVKN